jgi:hypothetical protein
LAGGFLRYRFGFSIKVLVNKLDYLSEAQCCRWCAYGVYGDFIKRGALGGGVLEASEKVSGNFLLSFIFGSSELVESSI